MKITNGDIFQAKEPLQTLMEMRFPVKTSFAIAKLASQISDKLRAIEEVRNSLIKKHGEPDPENKGQIGVKPDSKNFPSFVEDMNELMLQEEEIVFEKIKLPFKVSSTCDACKHNMDKDLEIEPRILMALEKFIDMG